MSVFALLCLAFLVGCFCGIKFATINILFLISAVAFVLLIKVIIFKTKTLVNLFVLGMVVVFTCGVGLGVYTDYKTFKPVQNLCGSEVTVNGNKVKDLNPRGNTTRAQVATILQRFCEGNK